jgi:hypothetical protein
MKRITLTLVALAAFVVNAQAETFTYACKVDPDGRSYLQAVKIDTTKKTLTWRGSVYGNLKPNLNCAKMGFDAVRKDGAGATLCIATQGVADLQILVGTAPLGDGIEQLECDQVRP